MIDSRTAPYAALVLRVALGVTFLAHAWLKLFVFSPAATVKFFDSLGLPEYVAYLVMAIEVVGGIALILGVLARWVALVLAVELIGMIVLVHGGKGWLFTNAAGGWEYPGLLAVAAIALALLGNGAYALSIWSRSAVASAQA